MKKQIQKDMTVGSPFKILMSFAMPMMLSMMFQQMYNFADSIIVGNFASGGGQGAVDALAAVGASYPITMIFIAIASGWSMGCSVVISQLFGSKDYPLMKTAISTSVISAITLSGILTLAGIFGCNGLMRLINTEEQIFGSASMYLRIYIFGLIFLFIYNISNSIFNALGNSKTPLYFLIFSSVLNVILDIVFVVFFHWDVAGVAWATFIAQGISSLLSVLYLIVSIKKIKSEDYKKFDWAMLGRISRIAIPTILQQSFISVGQLFVQGLINGYGKIAVAGYSAAFKIQTFFLTILNTMSSALSSFTAQNFGAGKLDRVKQGYKVSIRVTVGIVLTFMVGTLLFTPQLVGMFNKDLSVIEVGTSFLRVTAPFFIVVTFKIVADGILRGAGDMRAFMFATFADLIIRVVLAYLMNPWLEFSSVSWAYPIGWTVGTVISVYCYYKGTWKKAYI